MEKFITTWFVWCLHFNKQQYTRGRLWHTTTAEYCGLVSQLPAPALVCRVFCVTAAGDAHWHHSHAFLDDGSRSGGHWYIFVITVHSIKAFFVLRCLNLAGVSEIRRLYQDVQAAIYTQRLLFVRLSLRLFVRLFVRLYFRLFARLFVQRKSPVVFNCKYKLF